MKCFDRAVHFLLVFIFAACTANDEKLDFFEPVELPAYPIKQRPGWQIPLPWLKDLQKPEQEGGQDFMFSPNEDQPSQVFDHIYPYEVEDTYDDETSEKELDSNAPYGIQNVRDTKDVRRTKNNNHRSSKPIFQSLCQYQRKSINLNQNNVFEYRPDRYEEVSCLSAFYAADHNAPNHHGRNRVCGEAGFSCVQLNRTIFLTRRLRGTDCWESETRTVLAGCECMWPKHTFGDIAAHH